MAVRSSVRDVMPSTGKTRYTCFVHMSPRFHGPAPGR